MSEKATQPFLRLPVPKNEKPSAISYKALGRVLDAFAADLGRAEATLAGIKDDDVKLRLRLAKITFDFSGTGKDRTTLIDLLTKLNGGRLNFQKANPDFRVHFDRGDVAWLRAYCHLLSAMVEGYRAVDEEAGFEQRVKEIFPKVESPAKQADPDWISGLKVVDAPRLRRMRLHLVAVCELNRETWDYIRKETDDDYEWLPNPKQTDQLGLPLTDERIDAWLAMMKQWEGLLKGERLVTHGLLQFVNANHPDEQGLNLKKLLDDPPADLFNMDRIRAKGIDAKYLERREGEAVIQPAGGAGNDPTARRPVRVRLRRPAELTRGALAGLLTHTVGIPSQRRPNHPLQPTGATCRPPAYNCPPRPRRLSLVFGDGGRVDAEAIDAVLRASRSTAGAGGPCCRASDSSASRSGCGWTLSRSRPAARPRRWTPSRRRWSGRCWGRCPNCSS